MTDTLPNELTYNIVDILPTNEQLIKVAILAIKDNKLGLRSEQDEATAIRFSEYQDQCTAYGIEYEKLLTALCFAKSLENSSNILITKEENEENQTKLSDFLKWKGEYLAETGDSNWVDSKEGGNV